LRRNHARLLCALLLFSSLTARAAEPAAGAADYVRLCRAELEDRLFAGAAHGETFIVAQELKEEAGRARLRLDLASGEGRRIGGTCIFRDGKLFDVKQ
jgi:hypothetical protein